MQHDGGVRGHIPGDGVLSQPVGRSQVQTTDSHGGVVADHMGGMVVDESDGGRFGQVEADIRATLRPAGAVVFGKKLALMATLNAQLPAGMSKLPRQSPLPTSELRFVTLHPGIQSPEQPSSLCRLPTSVTVSGSGVWSASAGGATVPARINTVLRKLNYLRLNIAP